MLGRLETLYLGILRVVILVIATLALLAAALALASAVPTLLRHFGVVASPEPKGGTLGEFIAEKKLTSASGTSALASTPNTSNEETIDPDLAAAARALQRYTHGANGLTIEQWRTALQGAAGRVPVGTAPAYLRSVRHLTSQLLASKGAPLNPDQVVELLGWHETRFTIDANAQTAKEAGDGARFSLTLYAALCAFVLFILITFTFLFVKIERSLRVVRTRSVEDHYA